MTFEDWLEQVNRIFQNEFEGLSSDDFEDWGWYSAYSAGLYPQNAFKQWFEENYVGD